MIKIKRLFSLFLSLIFLVTWPSLAYGQDNTATESDVGDYTPVKEGQRVPFTGYLFDSGGIIKLINNKTLELQQLKITKDAEINKINMKAMNKWMIAAVIVAFGFSVNAQEVNSAKQDPVKKTETKPAKVDSKKVVQKKIKQVPPVKKEAEPMKNN